MVKHLVHSKKMVIRPFFWSTNLPNPNLMIIFAFQKVGQMAAYLDYDY
jgi:hypothetical protein